MAGVVDVAPRAAALLQDTLVYIEPDELRTAIRSGEAPVVVDVRSGWEFRRDRVPGAVHLPFWRVAVRHVDLEAERETPLVLYCGHGPRAAYARRALARLGYENLLVLRGHWRGWKREVGKQP